MCGLLEGLYNLTEFSKWAMCDVSKWGMSNDPFRGKDRSMDFKVTE